MTGSREDNQKVGQSGQPRKLPPIHMEGVRARASARGKFQSMIGSTRLLEGQALLICQSPVDTCSIMEF